MSNYWIFLHFRDFAYPTVKDRIPAILTKVIDTLHQQKGTLKEKHGKVRKFQKSRSLTLFSLKYKHKTVRIELNQDVGLLLKEGPEALKAIIGRLSKLRNEIQTDKVIVPLADTLPDVGSWNSHLEEEREREGEDPRWFLSPWLYTECYFYRRIHEAIQLR